jgi:hypothetical protein
VATELTAGRLAALADSLHRVRAAAADHRATADLTMGDILAVADAAEADLMAAAAKGRPGGAAPADLRADLKADRRHAWVILAAAALDPLWWEAGQKPGERIEITWANGAREAHVGEAITRSDGEVLHLEFAPDGAIIFPETGDRIGRWNQTPN